ncbi:UNVERIFIED_CONTAM: LuxR family two component transcriptional regulator [Acetivibrio alkalicellulosi]
MDIFRIGIVEDDVQWQKILSNYLNSYDDFQVIWVASQKDMAVNLLKETKETTDIIIMDIHLNSNKRDGIFATFDMCQQFDGKIIVLSAYSDGEIIRDAFSAGAVNYILKENYNEIPNAIRSALKGKTPIEEVLSEYKELKKESILNVLSPSEREAFQYLEEGKTISEISKLLHKTTSTIKSQVSSILKKLNVKTVKYAIEKVNKKGID